LSCRKSHFMALGMTVGARVGPVKSKKSCTQG
jgi:hypothetical protein